MPETITSPPCPHCASLEVSGTFVPDPRDKYTKPFRVQSQHGGTTTSYGDFDTIELARAGACGITSAVILQRA